MKKRSVGGQMINHYIFKRIAWSVFIFFISLCILTGCSTQTSVIFNDGTYTGELKEGLPHGEGTFKWKDGA